MGMNTAIAVFSGTWVFSLWDQAQSYKRQEASEERLSVCQSGYLFLKKALWEPLPWWPSAQKSIYFQSDSSMLLF